MIVKNLIALYQVRVNLPEHDCRLLMSWEQLSIPVWGVFQNTGKTKLRRRYLGSNEYTERVWSKKQVFGQAKKMTKDFSWRAVVAADLSCQFFLAVLSRWRVSLFQKVHCCSKTEVLRFKAFQYLWGVCCMEKVLANQSQNSC